MKKEPVVVDLFGYEVPQAPVDAKPIALTGKQMRAIGVYAKAKDLRLALSVPPRISFYDKKQLVTFDLDRIVAFYENQQKERAKERARERARLKRAAEQWDREHPEEAL